MNGRGDREPPSPAERRARVALALLVLPGLWMRFASLEWMEFSGDELAILHDSYRAVHEGPALHGIPASIGVRLPPGLLYLLALPIAVSRDPVAVAAFVALLNVGGLAALWVLGRRTLGATGALFLLALCASAPWPVLFARKIWNPDLLFPFTALAWAALASSYQRASASRTALAVVAFAFACQMHASTWIVAVPLLLWAVVFRAPLDRRGLAAGLGIALLLWAPWLAYLVSSGFDDVLHAWHMRAVAPAREGAPALARLVEHAAMALRTSGSLGFEGELAGEGGGPARAVLGAYAAVAAWTLFAACGLATALALVRGALSWARALRGERARGAEAIEALFAAMLATLVVVYGLGRFPPHAHYHAVLIPLPLYFLARFVEDRSWLRGTRAALLAGLFVLGNAIGFGALLANLRERGSPRSIGYAAAYEPHERRSRDELEALFAEVDQGHVRERAEELRRRTSFEASQDVLLRFDPARNVPAASAPAVVELEPTPEGLVVRGSTAVDMLRLPAFESEGGQVVVRLELDVPKEVPLLCFYETRSAPGWARERTLAARVPAGRRVLHLELPAPDASGALLLRVGAWRYVVRAYEVRRVR